MEYIIYANELLRFLMALRDGGAESIEIDYLIERVKEMSVEVEIYEEEDLNI